MTQIYDKGKNKLTPYSPKQRTKKYTRVSQNLDAPNTSLLEQHTDFFYVNERVLQAYVRWGVFGVFFCFFDLALYPYVCPFFSLFCLVTLVYSFF